MITACRDCAAWDPIYGNDIIGICRRHAPVVDMDRVRGKADRFPFSRSWDYCFDALSVKDHVGPPRTVVPFDE